jgi:hypothetical protein
MWDEPYFGLHHTTKRYRKLYISSRLCLRRSKAANFQWGLFLLHAPNDKHSIFAVCGFNGTSFVEVADILPKLATMVDRKCSSSR